MGKTIAFEPITNQRIINLCNQCVKDLHGMGIAVPAGVKYKQRKTTAWFGLARYASNDITLSTYILNDPDDELKKTIYHELAHLAANKKERGCGHRGLWKHYAGIISRKTGIDITRVTNARALGIHKEFVAAKESKNKGHVYTFVCPNCGSKVVLHKKNKFVQQYDYMDSEGEPMWWCSKCYKKFKKKVMFVKEEN